MIGVSKQLPEIGVKPEIIDSNKKLFIKLRTKEYTCSIIPQYLRPATWDNDLRNLKQYFQEEEMQNPILIGDFNVRIGEISQHMGEIYRESFFSGYDLRKSKDKTVNQKGIQFLQLCDDYNLYILNGITKGDEEGNLTYVTTVGDSVNDICAVSKELLRYTYEFKVEDKIWSDHFPILLQINVGTDNRIEEKMALLPKLIWKDKYKSNYQQMMSANLNKIAAINEISLNEICEIIKESYPKQNSRKPSFNSKHKWHNNNCNLARINTFKLLKIYRKTGILEDKRRYISAQKHYRAICNSSKEVYYNNMANNLNCIRNSKEWWKTAREMRNQHNLVSSNITPEVFRSYYEGLLNNSEEITLIYYAPFYKEDSDLDGPFTMIELKKILASVKTNKAPGEDRIPYEFFMNATDQFHNLLLNTYNRLYTNGKIDPIFSKTIIFPIHKKGDLNEASNYRGISFMNCAAKIFMGLMNEKLYNWVEQNKILTEFQSGFRKNYATTDNIYNLASIVNLKLSEKKKVYAFFVDFKAAFDNISRQALIYKLFQMGISYKFVRLVEQMYNNTQSAVWNGKEISEYFETTKGVKQGCLLSPLLFTLYINDLHDYIEGGLCVESINIRLLLYADDIVLLADDIKILQNMIDKLELYCKRWSLEVNISKSEIMVFRNGGKLSKYEKWTYKGREIKICNEFKYLGVVFTPKMKFHKHVQNRNNEAKNAINSIWKQFMERNDINMNNKWKVFLAVCRSIQTYAAQVWGYSYFEEVNTLQRYLLKRILRVPSFTPNYVLMLETDVEDTQIYTLGLHLKYIEKTLYHHEPCRLPKQLSNIILEKNTFWAKEIATLSQNFNIQWDQSTSCLANWRAFCKNLLSSIKMRLHEERLWRQQNCQSLRIYKYLNPNRAQLYLNDKNSYNKIVWIFKTRSGMIPLGYNKFDSDTSSRECKLCNLREIETIQHFLGKCPVLQEFRMLSFQRPILNEEEVIRVLDGEEEEDWDRLANYMETTYKYRNFLMNEFD